MSGKITKPEIDDLMNSIGYKKKPGFEKRWKAALEKVVELANEGRFTSRVNDKIYGKHVSIEVKPWPKVCTKCHRVL